MNPRDQAACAAFGMAAKAGLGLDYRQDLGALDAGVRDATRGRLHGDSRLRARHDSATYALGYALGRYALGLALTYLDGRGEAGKRTWQAFADSREGQGWSRQYGQALPPLLSQAESLELEQRLRQGGTIPKRLAVSL